jgi:oxalate decarboxylase/phosphoglucose isomerase-like protein (cupin superfamily)
MHTPEAIRPLEHAAFDPDKMGKVTLFRSNRILVGLNCFEPGQEHRLHTHAGQDKVYHVLSGRGRFVLQEKEVDMEAGVMLIAPEGVAHGIRNTGTDRLIVLAVLAPAP